jgi:hypothetical protein
MTLDPLCAAWSVGDVPLSDAASMSGTVEAVGITVSIKTDKGVGVTLLPATSVTRAVTLCIPFARAATVLMLHCPVAVATPVPI